MLRWRSAFPTTLCSTLILGACPLPSTAQSNQGAQRFVEYCAACHGADARGGDKGPSLLSPVSVAASDDDLIRVIHDGTSQGMPPFAQIGNTNIAAVIHYLRVLQGTAAGSTGSESSIPGNPAAGQDLFFGKARCFTCHMMQGQGGFIAGGLTNYGRNRTPQAVLHAILSPDDPLIHSSRVVNVTTSAGQRITGVLRNEDAFGIDVQTEDGRFHMLPMSDVSDIQHTDHSLMPSDYATRLTSKQLNDIVSFLIVSARDSNKSTRQGN